MNYLNAFWVGGLICALCQVLIDKTKRHRRVFSFRWWCSVLSCRGSAGIRQL